jgi:CubicO group peptidase (beta-lactamase class C family)
MAFEDRALVALSIAFVRVLVIAGCLMGSAAQAQEMTREKVAALPAFLDATVPKLMEEGHVAGTAVAVVHEGRVTVLRGYGKARLDSGAAVDPSRTLFRIGSVTKVLTAAAALQLVDAGKLDLQRDIREYVPDMPLRYGATTHQLLTHTTGLLERFAGEYTDAPEHLQTLRDHLRRYMPAQDRRPGLAYSYSNYNTALTGLLVEQLSGLTYPAYMAERIFKPLKMTGTTALQPPEPSLMGDLARGYRWNGRQEPLPYSYTQTGPAGGISATAADMGRFMQVLLGDGSVDGERILSPESVKTMLASQYTPDARIQATAYEMKHWATHGQHLLHKDGTLGDQIGVMLLAPADRFGIFVASNAVPGVANDVLEPLLTYLVGPETPTRPPAPLPDAGRRAPRFAGSYRNYARTRNEMSQVRALMPMLQSRVIAEPDGAIRWQGRRWLEVEPLVFRSADSPDYIVFRENGRGGIGELHAWGATYERVGWWEQAPFHLGVLFSCMIAFLAYPLSRGIRALRRRPAPPELRDQAAPGGDQPARGGRVARACAIFVAIANLTFVVGLVASLRELGAITPLPLPFVLLLSLPLASVAATALLAALAARAWREHWWTRGERLGYSTFVVLAVAFMAFLNYWKLLGIRY